MTARPGHPPECMDAVDHPGHVLLVIDVSGLWVEDLPARQETPQVAMASRQSQVGWCRRAGGRDEAPLPYQHPPALPQGKGQRVPWLGKAEGSCYRGKPHVAHGIAPVVDVIRVPEVKPSCLEKRS